MLTEEQLIGLDEFILDFLRDHEWASPHVIRVFHNEDKAEEETVSRQWVSKRITRLHEHGCVEHVHPDTSAYELVADPREVDP